MSNELFLGDDLLSDAIRDTQVILRGIESKHSAEKKSEWPLLTWVVKKKYELKKWWARTKGGLKRWAIYKKYLPNFANLWYQLFPNFLFSYLKGLRIFLTKPLFPGYSIMPEPKDAFWVIHQLRLDFVYDNVIWGIKQGFNWFTQLPAVNFLIQALRLDVAVRALIPIAKTVAPYLPVIALGLGALGAIKEFIVTKNKNIFTLGKMLGKVSGAVLLGVGMGLMTWGGAIGMLYTGPALIVAAAVVMGTVGLVKFLNQLYQASQVWHDSVQRNIHLKNALKDLVIGFINAFSAVLTLFGAQAIQQVTQGFSTADWSLFGNAATIYQKTVWLSNAVLATVGGLAVAKLGSMALNTRPGAFIARPFIWAGVCLASPFIWAWNKCRGPQNQVIKQEAPTLQSLIMRHHDKIQDEITGAKKVIDNGHTSCINKKFQTMRNNARAQKVNVLAAAKIYLDSPTFAHRDELLLVENQAKRDAPVLFSVYQSSFFSKTKTGTTEELVRLALAEPVQEPEQKAPEPQF